MERRKTTEGRRAFYFNSCSLPQVVFHFGGDFSVTFDPTYISHDVLKTQKMPVPYFFLLMTDNPANFHSPTLNKKALFVDSRET